MSKDLNVIDILRHYRHDWLNHLQLINGYLSMGKVEKVESLIEEVVRQAKNESQLSNLNLNYLAEEVLTFNWKSHSFYLSFEVTSEADWSENEKLVNAFFHAVVSLLDSHTVYGEEHHAILIINDVEKKTIEIDFHGALIIDHEWQEKTSRIKREFGNHIEQIEWNESDCYLKFCVEEGENSSLKQNEELQQCK